MNRFVVTIDGTERLKEALSLMYLFWYSVLVKCICEQNNVSSNMKDHLWQSSCCYAKCKRCCGCFTVNFINILKMDILQNLLGGVFLDIKSLTMCDRLKTVRSFLVSLHDSNVLPVTKESWQCVKTETLSRLTKRNRSLFYEMKKWEAQQILKKGTSEFQKGKTTARYPCPNCFF